MTDGGWCAPVEPRYEIETERYLVRTASGALAIDERVTRRRCLHANVVDVDLALTGEIVARLCLDCDEKLDLLCDQELVYDRSSLSIPMPVLDPWIVDSLDDKTKNDIADTMRSIARDVIDDAQRQIGTSWLRTTTERY